MTDERPVLPDQAERDHAWKTRASLVVEASAGTGKTSLLIQRALWLILDGGVPMERIVALSFTEKAAAEVAQRLREALRRVARAESLDALPEAVRDMSSGKSLNRVQLAARAALDAFERANVTTIHSFASRLIGLYPAEAKVDPDFRIIEEPERQAVLTDEWEIFLAGELGSDGAHPEEWGRVLETASVGDLKDLAFELARFRVRIDDLAGAGTGVIHPEIARWLSATRDEAALLEATLEKRSKKPAAMLGAVRAVAGAILDGGRKALGDNAALLKAAPDMGSGWPKAWTPEQVRRGSAVNRALRELKTAVAERPALDALKLLVPFAARARDALLKRGLMTFDGLIALACDLVREHVPVREQLKRKFAAILVDEVQDVDPVQLELLLFLAETPGEAARDWRQVKLAPGKLVLVGDPKQSIYGFRHADLKAYQAVVDMARRQDAVHVRLSTSMRSSAPIIAAVNAGGARWFQGGSGPGYLALQVNPARKSREDPDSSQRRPQVLRVTRGPDEDSGTAEARAVAAWLMARGTEEGRTTAVLFPQKRGMPAVAAALRAAGMEVAIEEERQFYLRPEVIDVLNVLRVVADPADEVAVAGVLRGPFGGLDDDGLQEWFSRWRSGKARSTLGEMAATSRDPAFPQVLAGVFDELDELSKALESLPPRMLVERLFSALAIEAVSAASGRPGAGPATAALKGLLGDLVSVHGIRRTIELLAECVREESRDGGEPPVRPPSLTAGTSSHAGAVRLMTIHQAKGLEFSTVILAGTYRRHRVAQATETKLRYEWSSGLAGVTLRTKSRGEAVATLEGAYLTIAEQRRDDAQDLRVLYVALTRACDELVIIRVSGRDSDERPPDGSLLRHLATVLDEDPGLFEDVEARIDDAGVAPGPVGATGAVVSVEPAAGEVERWEARMTYVPPRSLIHPSEYGERFEAAAEDPLSMPGSRSAEQWVGELCHRVLEKWDFTGDSSALESAIALVVATIPDATPVPDGVRERVEGILAEFVGSRAAERLAGAEILGREVPFVAEVDGATVVARADLVMRLDGKLTIGDYKLAEMPSVPDSVAHAYRGVATAALGEPVEFVLISLKGGVIIS